MSPYHGWLYGQGSDGALYEVINQARLAAYLKNPTLTLPSGFSICDVLDFGGCEAYAYNPPCDGDPGYVDFPGVVGNYLTTPDAALLDITGDITLIAEVALDDWSPAVPQTLISKWTTGSNLSYAFSIQTGGLLQFQWTTNGTTINTATSATGLAALSPGERRSLRVDMDVVNGTNKTIRFYTATDHDHGYVLLDTYQTAGTTSIFSGSSAVLLGSLTTVSQPLSGRMYYANIRNGISGNATVGGTSALEFDADAITNVRATTLTATGGQVLTITETGSPGIILGLGPTSWEPAQYISPAVDPAPWYDPGRPESALAYGFFVQEWSGLGNSHVVRPVSKAGRFRSRQGALAAKERVMALNVLAVGGSEQAVEYLFQWLESTLENTCSGCADDSMYLRRFCPTGQDKGEGVAELRQVGLSEGVDWGNDPFSVVGQCYIRSLTFTLTAGDPCMYANGTTPAVETQVEALGTCLSALQLSTSRRPCRPTCNELSSNCRNIYTFEANSLGSAAPVVKLVNNSSDWAMPMRMIAYANPGDQLTSGSNTCGMPRLGELYLGAMPPYSELTWDVAGRDVTYYDVTTGGDVSGWFLVDANDPPLSRFDFVLPCGTGHIVFEPATACLSFVNNHYYNGSVDLGQNPHFPTATVTVQERFGCG